MVTIKRRSFLVRHARTIFYFFKNPLVGLHGRIFKPEIPGAKTFVFHQDKLLLVRLGYAHKKWVLPGGKIDKGETPMVAAIREVHEESGVLLSTVTFLCEKRYERKDRNIDMHYFYGNVDSEDLVIDGQEIIDAKWFSLDNLPNDCAPRLATEIALYEKHKLRRD